MASHQGLKMNFVERKVFEDFGRCKDRRAYDAACEGQLNGYYREFRVRRIYPDADLEYLRQWLFKNGVTEDDEVVFLSICW